MDNAGKARVSIREAGADDVERVVALNGFVQELHADARPDLFRRPGKMPGVVEHYRAVCRDPSRIILLGEVDGRAAGYVVFEVQRRPANPFTHARVRLHVDQIGVDPAFRGRGVARALLDQVSEEARRRGIRTVTLDAWNFNRDARRSFERMGFATYRLGMEKTL